MLLVSTPEDKAQKAQDAFTRKAALYGSSVFLPGGTALTDAGGDPLKAFQDHNVKAILGGLTGEDSATEKPAVALYFPAAGVEVVQENMSVLLGPAENRRSYRIASPLHPQQVADVVIYLACVAYPG